jgi:hypothetical protein
MELPTGSARPPFGLGRAPETATAIAREGAVPVTPRPDCVAGHVGFEPANPSASCLIGIA